MSTFNSSYLNTGAFYRTPNPTIQVLFPSDWPSYYTGFVDADVGINSATRAFTPLTASQQEVIRLALSMWSNYVAVNFVDTPAPGGNKISFGITPLLASGVGYYPIWRNKLLSPTQI